MKETASRILLIVAGIFLLPVIIFAQILNGGFEDWTGINPDNWYVNNVPGFYVPITESSTSHSGNHALEGQVVTFSNTTVPPILISGGSMGGFTVSEKYLSLEGYYQFKTDEADQLDIAVIMYDSTSSVIGGGSLEILTPVSTYTLFSVGIEYFYPDLTPDKVLIEMIVSNSSSDSVHLGTEFLLDDLSLSMTPTNVQITPTPVSSTMALAQNYPNPFNPVTMISFSLAAASEVTLSVYDITGKQVDKLIDRQEMASGYHSLQWKPNSEVPSGVYFYRLKTGTFSQTKRMLFIK
jgi:hypothetical protein